MKKLLVALALFIGTGALYNTVEAQNINISINVGRQPAWGPVGYDYVGYYYFPDIDVYYNVDLRTFHYYNRGRWIQSRYLPIRYHDYDLYALHKVVLNVNNPWKYHHTHRRDYARYVGYRKQVVIRDSRDVRYRDSRNNRVTWYSDNRKAQQKREYIDNYNGRSRNSVGNDKYTNGRNGEVRSTEKRKNTLENRSNNSNSREKTVRQTTPNNKRTKDGKIEQNSSSSRKTIATRLVSN